MVRHISRPGAYVSELASPHRIVGASTSVTAFVGRAARGPVDRPERLSSEADYARVFGEPGRDNPLGLAVRDFFRNGGTDAVAVRSTSEQAGIAALEDGHAADLLVLAPDVPGAAVGPRLVATAAQLCERRGAMLLLDAPASWCTVDDVLRAAAAGFETTLGTTSRNAALFFPGLREVEESSGSLAAAVAGLYARTDRERGVWKAPAGIGATVAGAPALAVRLDADDIGRLAAVGVNGMREIPGTGTVVWGARTLAGGDGGEPEWRYVPVRRTALHLEKSVHAGTQWAVFEPNGERLWAAVRSQVEDFLRELWRAGGFVGATEDEAFFVRCDATTTTPSDIDRGLMNLQIGFAPLRPAEFVMLTIQQRLVAADLPRVPEEQS